MPLDERFRLDDDKRTSPIEELRQCNHRQPRHRCRRARLHLSFPEERKLLAQEQIFGDQSRASRYEQSKECEQETTVSPKRITAGAKKTQCSSYRVP